MIASVDMINRLADSLIEPKSQKEVALDSSLDSEEFEEELRDEIIYERDEKEPKEVEENEF